MMKKAHLHHLILTLLDFLVFLLALVLPNKLLEGYVYKFESAIPFDGHCSSFTLPVRARHHGDYFQKRSDLARDCMVISHWGVVCPTEDLPQ